MVNAVVREYRRKKGSDGYVACKDSDEGVNGVVRSYDVIIGENGRSCSWLGGSPRCLGFILD